MLRLAEL
jgi:hypothetical protein